jgi:hypothetical protein
MRFPSLQPFNMFSSSNIQITTNYILLRQPFLDLVAWVSPKIIKYNDMEQGGRVTRELQQRDITFSPKDLLLQNKWPELQKRVKK